MENYIVWFYKFIPNGLGSCLKKFTISNKVPITTSHFENVSLHFVTSMIFLLTETLLQYANKTYTKRQCVCMASWFLQKIVKKKY